METSFDFGRPFQYQFQDPSWMKKVLILAICPFIPLIGGFVMMGHSVRIMRHVADGNEGLPEWSDFGGDILNGLQAFLIALVYFMPPVVVYIAFNVLGVVLALILEAANIRNTPIPGLVMLLGMLISVGLFIVSALMVPVGIARFADKGRIGAAFSPKAVFGMLKNNAMNVVMAFLVGIAANFIGMLGMIACFIGVYFTMALAVTMRGHAWGQVIRIARQREGQTPEYAPAPEPDAPTLAPAY